MNQNHVHKSLLTAPFLHSVLALCSDQVVFVANRPLQQNRNNQKSRPKIETAPGLAKRNPFLNDDRRHVESGLVSAWVLCNIVPKVFWKPLPRCGRPWCVFTACPLVVQARARSGRGMRASSGDQNWFG